MKPDKIKQNSICMNYLDGGPKWLISMTLSNLKSLLGLKELYLKVSHNGHNLHPILKHEQLLDDGG